MNDSVIDTNAVSDGAMRITPEIKAYLLTTAKWGTFLAIVGFIFCAFTIIMAFSISAIMAAAMGSIPPGMGDMPPGMGPSSALIPTGLMTAYFILMAVIQFFPCLYLYRFSSKMKLAIASDDQEFLADGFKNLKSLFKFFGIFTAIFVGLYLILLLIVFLGGFASMLF